METTKKIKISRPSPNYIYVETNGLLEYIFQREQVSYQAIASRWNGQQYKTLQDFPAVMFYDLTDRNLIDLLSLYD